MWDDATAKLLLSWLDWVELEVAGVDARLVEGLRRLRRAAGRDSHEEAWELELDLGEVEKLLWAAWCEARVWTGYWVPGERPSGGPGTRAG